MKFESVLTAVVSTLISALVLAAVAVLVSKKSDTPGILSQAGSSFSQIITCALSPVTGGTCPQAKAEYSSDSSITFGNVVDGVSNLSSILDTSLQYI